MIIYFYILTYWKEQAQHKAKKRKMREIRGGGKNVMEEEAEEEHDFEEDEEVADEEIEPKSATADAATAGTATGDAATAGTATGDAATADAATGDAPLDAATADAATGDATAHAETADAATRDAPSMMKPGEQQVLRRVRGKRKAPEAAEAISTPSPVQPRRLFSGSSLASLPSPASSSRESSGRKRQATLGRFFSPASGEQEPDEEPPELPKKPAWRIKDTIKALVNMGSITDQGEVIRGNQQLIEQLSSAVQQTMEYKQMKKQKGGRPIKIGKLRGVAGGMKTNMRLKGQKRLRDELPVATKHDMCLQIHEMRVEYASEKDTLKAAARKFKMRVKKLQAIWMKRLEWKSQVAKYKLSSGVHDRPGSSGAMKGSHGPHAAKQQRKRASGGGRKLSFPLLYEKTKNWFHDERAHGHTVLRRHVAWKFQEFLTTYKLDLQTKQDNQELSHQEKHDLQAAEKMLEAMSSRQGNADKRADHIIKWMGAKIQQPNLVTQISEVEQQVRAELTWQHHDYLISKIAQMREDDYKELFARPDQAKQQMRTCALCFSDQVPLWVKKPSSREVFAHWELRTSSSSVQIHRLNIKENLDQKSQHKALADHAEGGEKKDDQQIVEHEGDAEDWHIGTADQQQASGKKHLTTLREANVDKYRITFEAHQMVSGFFNPDEAPQGHVLPGILIVPGPHAALSNISEKGEWISDEKFFHAGQMRLHKKGNSVGRTLEPWRKLRASNPQLMRHFHVYSQPSSNTDGVIMSWVIRDMSKTLGMRLHCRDMFGAAFVDEVRNMQFLGHEVASNIMGKMTASMQLTDTDFAHEFKSRVKNQVDELMRQGMANMRNDEAAPSDQYKMSIKDVATAIDSAMEHMVQKNEKDQWVLAGLRRNGFLVLRPNEKGQLIYQSQQSWCKHLPVGSTRISENWLKNRMSWIKDAGRSVDPPNWERITGAKELADLIEWSYQHGSNKEDTAEQVCMDLQSASEPEWVSAGQFQLPLELRRQLAVKEMSMTEDARKKRDKLRQKRADKKMRADAKKILTDEQKEEIRSTLQSSSRLEAMQQIVPSAKNPTAKQQAKKTLKNKKKMQHMTADKKAHKAAQKAVQKQAVKNAIVKAAKQQTALAATDPPPPLPPPDEAPPAESAPSAATASAKTVPSGTFRIVSEHAGMTLYGRQGSVLGMGDSQWQLLLEKDSRNSIGRMAWVQKGWLERIPEDIKNKAWSFPQVTLSRQIRQHILLQTGAISEDLEDDMLISDEVEVLGKDPPGNGIDGMHILFGWQALKYMVTGKKFDEIPGLTLLDPSLCCPLALPADKQHHDPELLDKLKKLLVHKMSKDEGTFLAPLAAGGHWSLLVISKDKKQIRYYDSLAGSDEKADIGLAHEIANMPEKCLAMAENLLGIMLDLGCIKDELLHRPALMRENQKCRQPWGSNLCGQFVLAYIEKEVGHN